MSEGDWTQIWFDDPTERLTREIYRRIDAVEMFHNRQAIVRIIAAVLAEQADEWVEDRRYLTLEARARSRATILATVEPKDAFSC